MNVGRVILQLATAYSITLVIVAILTLLWIINPSVGKSPEIAGLWFALGGFGVLVALTIALVHLSR